MALVKCTECNKEISPEALACPGCGSPTKAGKGKAKSERNKKRSNLQGAGCLLIVLSIILGLTLVGLPFAVLLGGVGLVVLVIGFFS